METLALELEPLEEKHGNKESEAKISYSDPTTSGVMNKFDEDHDQQLKKVNLCLQIKFFEMLLSDGYILYILVYQADGRLLSSSDKSEEAEDLTSEEDYDCDLDELDKKIANVKTYGGIIFRN
ncbi:hypothetical protein Ddye_025838 [Dipteronia dyeriana]|uniref:Uncharacterized protein n=1 Tax=Dipteronia dyeriana TaxID=168575 RepID=A0AAD9WPX0_9ROSI|nr:hypothetical protein Ddye_025838 [Dipteronia dyeriana]